MSSGVVVAKRVDAPSNADGNALANAATCGEVYGTDLTSKGDASKHVVAKVDAGNSAREGEGDEPQQEEDEDKARSGTRGKRRRKKRSDEDVVTWSDKPSRGKRRRGKNTAKTPSASLFVGYCEDEETIEMIMRKFEAVEKIKEEHSRQKEEQQSSSSSGNGEVEGKACDAAEGSEQGAESDGADNSVTYDNGLDEAMLAKVFQETSSFSLQHATREMYRDEFDEMVDEDDGFDMGGITTAENADGETLFFMGDGTDDDDLWEEIFGKKKRKRSGTGRRVARAESSGVTQIAFVSDMHSHFVTGLKKIKKVDPNAIVYQKIPNIIPKSWAKRIAPFRPKTAVHAHTLWRPDSITANEDDFTHKTEVPANSVQVKVDKVLGTEWMKDEVLARGPFEGIVLSPPWKSARLPLIGSDIGEASGFANPNSQVEYGIEPEDLVKLDLGRKGLMTSGFCYVWTPKHLIHRVLRALEKMDLHYVENAAFVKQNVNNKLWHEPSRYFRQSKETLLICRRGKKHPVSGKLTWAPVEIRHQRSPDVHFGFLHCEQAGPKKGLHHYPHSYVHNMAETMLPHGRFNPLPALSTGEDPRAPARASDAKEGDDVVVTKQGNRSNKGAKDAQKDEGPCQGKLLHLWANPESQRTGWVTVFDKGL